MKTSTLTRALGVAALAALGMILGVETAQAQSIGVHFTSGAHTLAAADQPGIAPGANWNNVITAASGTNVPLQDNTGAATSALLTFNSTVDYEFFSGTNTPNAATNLLYHSGLVGSNISPEVGINVTNIPYASYDVYVYASADTTATNTLSITNGSTTFYYRSDGRTNNFAASLLLTTSTNPLSPTVGLAQYQIFSGLTGSSFTLTTGGSITDVISNNVFGLQIVSRSLSLASLSPSSVVAAGGALALTLTGSGFAPNAQVKYNGTNLTTTYISSTQLTAVLPASLTATPGQGAVLVFNPTSGATSGSRTFTVLSGPRLGLTAAAAVRLGNGSVQVNYTITNYGTATANGVSVSLARFTGTGGSVVSAPNGPVNLAPGATLTGQVIFPSALTPGTHFFVVSSPSIGSLALSTNVP